MGEVQVQKSVNLNSLISRTPLQKFKHTNPYLNFFSEFRSMPEHKNLQVKDVFKLAGCKWKHLSDQEKFPYIAAAKEIRQRVFKNKNIKKPHLKKKKRLQPTKDALERRLYESDLETTSKQKNKKTFEVSYTSAEDRSSAPSRSDSPGISTKKENAGKITFESELSSETTL